LNQNLTSALLPLIAAQMDIYFLLQIKYASQERFETGYFFRRKDNLHRRMPSYLAKNRFNLPEMIEQPTGVIFDDITVQKNREQTKTFELFPKGTHMMQVIDVNLKDTKSGNGVFIEIELENKRR